MEHPSTGGAVSGPGVSRAARVLLYAGGVVLILAGLAHTAAQLANSPAPKNDKEATLFDLMRTYQFEAAGSTLTMEGILTGFGWYFSLMAAVQGVGAILVTARRPSDRGLLALCAWFNAAVLAIVTGISVKYFPLPPVGLFGVATVAFLAAGISLRARAS